ncbi:lantibiotic dehydratase [Paenibacillus sp. 481]|uniref:lantibiotic dehydratase n=1 Tax=Paenibacillus sp. 481 TaxID=2835869 RepID=UPI001E4659B0|nr:lantibiotic dehydratase [Paenibacillus sp. 481]UHA73645.1 lantibiotic dehydratase [Paenibacillus sp. 481]
MTSNKNVYKTLDFFMVRTPILPLNLFTANFPSEWDNNNDDLKRFSLNCLIQLSNDPIIREAIIASSPSLLQSLSHLSNEDNLRKQGQVVKGFMRYLLRMMSRPTPFGLFSGVTHGHFANQSQLNLEGIHQYRKRARPDMEWLLKLTGKLESQREIVSQLRIQRNTLIYRQGDRAKIPYTTRYGRLNSGENDSVSVRASAVFDKVMEVCANQIPYLELISILQVEFVEASMETIHQYVWQLFEQEFLISNLRPPTTTTEPFDHILSVLDPVTGIEELKTELRQIRIDIRQYDDLPIGQGEQQLLNLRQAMDKIVEAKSSLQIDLSLEDQSITLHNRIREDVEKTADLMSRMATQSNRHLQEYQLEFLEKYGPYREVSLLELLDEEIGLGPPVTYDNPPSYQRRANHSASVIAKRDQLLLNWFMTSLHKGVTEVVLTDEMIEQLLENSDSADIMPAPSMELYFLLVAHNEDEIERGEYKLVLGPNPGSVGAGKTFGRFIDMLGDSFKEEFGIINDEEQRLSPHKILAEISYLPSAGRSTNVVLTENYRKYEIAIGTNHTVSADRQIHVSDLVVGVRNNAFYLKSRKNNREIVPKAGHMLNYQSAPNVYRFLMEMGQEGCKQWTTFDWGAAIKSPFSPRLRYNNVILSPATWRIHIHQKPPEQDNGAWIKRIVEQFRMEWKVPRYVYMVQFDNRILLDLDHPLHIEEVYKDLKSSSTVTLIEHVGTFEEAPIQRSDGRLTAEFVFPLVKRNESFSSSIEEVAGTIDNSDALNLPPVNKMERVHLPGGEWFYVKLYGLDSRQDEFIGRYWEAFVQQCREAGVIEHAYFIRFLDPIRHIRARFQMPSENNQHQFLPIFHKWTNNLLSEGLITKVVIDTYEPEIERYGGPELMVCAERMFAFDSHVVANLVRLTRFNQIQLSQEIISILSVIELFYQFGYNDEQIVHLLNRHFDVKEYLDEFRKERALLFRILTSDKSELKSVHPEGDMIAQICKLRETAVSDYQEKIVDYEQKGMLMNTREDILFSVIHMHINRLQGTDRDKERKVMIMARHTMNSLVQYRRKCK